MPNVMPPARQTPHPHLPFALGITNCRPAREVIGCIRQAEQCGAEMAFVAEDINCRDAFQLCALAAGVTERIRLSTGVINPYTRNPTSIAMAVATLAEVSGGRAALGLGTSSPSLITEQMGIPSGRPQVTMAEVSAIVRALLRGETVTRAGEHFTYREAALAVPVVQEHIPIFFAAMGPRMLRLAGALADGVLLNVGASTDYIRWAVSQVHAGALEAGRKPEEVTIAAWMSAYVVNDYESGLRRAREWLAGVLSIPRQGELLLEHGGGDLSILPAIRAVCSAYPHAGDRVAAAQHVPPGLAARLTVIGDVDQVRARLGEYREAGVQLPVLGSSAVKALYAK